MHKIWQFTRYGTTRNICQRSPKIRISIRTYKTRDKHMYTLEMNRSIWFISYKSDIKVFSCSLYIYFHCIPAPPPTSTHRCYFHSPPKVSVHTFLGFWGGFLDGGQLLCLAGWFLCGWFLDHWGFGICSAALSAAWRGLFAVVCCWTFPTAWQWRFAVIRCGALSAVRLILTCLGSPAETLQIRPVLAKQRSLVSTKLFHHSPLPFKTHQKWWLVAKFNTRTHFYFREIEGNW